MPAHRSTARWRACCCSSRTPIRSGVVEQRSDVGESGTRLSTAFTMQSSGNQRLLFVRRGSRRTARGVLGVLRALGILQTPAESVGFIERESEWNASVSASGFPNASVKSLNGGRVAPRRGHHPQIWAPFRRRVRAASSCEIRLTAASSAP